MTFFGPSGWDLQLILGNGNYTLLLVCQLWIISHIFVYIWYIRFTSLVLSRSLLAFSSLFEYIFFHSPDFVLQCSEPPWPPNRYCNHLSGIARQNAMQNCANCYTGATDVQRFMYTGTIVFYKGYKSEPSNCYTKHIWTLKWFPAPTSRRLESHYCIEHSEW